MGMSMNMRMKEDEGDEEEEDEEEEDQHDPELTIYNLTRDAIPHSDDRRFEGSLAQHSRLAPKAWLPMPSRLVIGRWVNWIRAQLLGTCRRWIIKGRIRIHI